MTAAVPWGRCPHCQLNHALEPGGCWRAQRQRLRAWVQVNDHWTASYRRTILRAVRRGWKETRRDLRAWSPYRQTNYQRPLNSAWQFGRQLALLSRLQP